MTNKNKNICVDRDVLREVILEHLDRHKLTVDKKAIFPEKALFSEDFVSLADHILSDTRLNGGERKQLFRDSDVIALAKGVLDSNGEFWDNPNGPYEMTCSFCSKTMYYGGDRSDPNISELPHSSDCEYLIAKDIMTGIEPKADGQAKFKSNKCTRKPGEYENDHIA